MRHATKAQFAYRSKFMRDEENDRPAFGKRDPLEVEAMKVKLTLNGQGGEFDSHVFLVAKKASDSYIRQELIAWIGDMTLDVGDMITITEVA